MPKLSELNPKLAGGILTFDCPVCTQGFTTSDPERSGLDHKIRVPIRPAPPNNLGASWESSGLFPDSLTLQPSVNAGCFHGFITNGEVK